MSDINDESRHIESIDRFLTVCIERLQTETKTSDRFFTQTAFNNAIKEFVIAEARNNRKKLDDIDSSRYIWPQLSPLTLKVTVLNSGVIIP